MILSGNTSASGDVNKDGDIDITDITFLIDYLLGLDVDIDITAADCQIDNKINIADVTKLIDYLLNGAW